MNGFVNWNSIRTIHPTSISTTSSKWDTKCYRWMNEAQLFDWWWKRKAGSRGGEEVGQSTPPSEETNQLMDDFQWCTEEELEKICRRRSPPSTPKNDDQSRASFKWDEATNDVPDSNPLDVVRRERERQLHNIYLDVFNVLSSTKVQLQLSDLIIEDNIPDFGYHFLLAILSGSLTILEQYPTGLWAVRCCRYWNLTVLYDPSGRIVRFHCLPWPSTRRKMSLSGSTLSELKTFPSIKVSPLPAHLNLTSDT